MHKETLLSIYPAYTRHILPKPTSPLSEKKHPEIAKMKPLLCICVLLIALISTGGALLSEGRHPTAKKYEFKGCKHCAPQGGGDSTETISGAVLSAEAHPMAKKYKLRGCKRCARRVGDDVRSAVSMKIEVNDGRELVATTENVRPSTPGRSPGVGHRLNGVDSEAQQRNP
ncbi:hypothetical protein MUK42_06819 [Musa troglodytarum]|uniref:Uncharacterized protein n=1 Tax=Musa troglodytarum TaxID=320322 RepID=A0A9E7KEN5_9LILI|nr:hypothetical protein MUK42_06819 [Musa troglodytarum]